MSLDVARRLASDGDVLAAQRAYLAVLHHDPTHFDALTELAALALSTGHRSAALTAHRQAARAHPANPIGRVNLGNLLFDDGDIEAAGGEFRAALAADPAFPPAHQGLARVLADRGDPAPEHWRQGFVGHAVVRRPHRGPDRADPVLLLVSARGGNIPTRHWTLDRRYDVTAIYADFFDPAGPLPRHRLIVNAIGEADLCADALHAAERIAARSGAPIINAPSHVRRTGRADNARRLGALPGVVAPRTTAFTRATLLEADLAYPLLVRVPGHHTGQHFQRVAARPALAATLAGLPGDDFLSIEYLDARGPDGWHRKYRVLFIDGHLYPLHLAIAADWKVHHFTAGMAEHQAHRAEEAGFLADMAGTIGPRAMTALAAIAATLGLDYAGVDFGLAPDGDLLLFEANATMVLNPPDPDPIWAYRSPAIDAALAACRAMIARRITPRSAASSTPRSDPSPAAIQPSSPSAQPLHR